KFKETEIGKICTVTSSKRIFQADYVKEGIPFFRSKEIIEKAQRKKISTEFFISQDKFIEIKEKFGAPKKGDILLSSVGARSGIPYYVIDESEFYFKDGNLIWLKEFEDIISSQYVFLWLNSMKIFNILKNVMIGSAQPALTIEQVKKLIIQFPSKKKQIAIVEMISSLTRQIQNIQNQNKILEQMAQTIFKSWFVDFDGVTEWDDSELGKIPNGWGVEKISDVCETFGGGTPSTKNPNYWDGQNYWLAPSDLTSLNRVFCVDSKRKITDEGLQNCASKIHPENSILMTSRATIGVFCINKIPVATNQGFIVSKPNNPDHIYYIFLNYRNRVDEFLQNANGSTFLEISRSNFRQLPILIPTPEILDKFHVMVKLLFENIFINEKMIEGLTKTRDVLLPKLMSGEIRV
ncbi:MAG: hypothetical protein HOL90_05610, partial [Candidatus Nitrosopelagicus sp.]|nr:hypothetical protein [Candidatus Nitrosopelagicus sp.]